MRALHCLPIVAWLRAITMLLRGADGSDDIEKGIQHRPAEGDLALGADWVLLKSTS